MELDIFSNSYFSPPTFNTVQSQPGLPLNGFQIHFLFSSPKAMALMECPIISRLDRLQPPSSFPCPPVLSHLQFSLHTADGIFLTKNQIIVTFLLHTILALGTEPDASRVSRPIHKLAPVFLSGPLCLSPATHPHHSTPPTVLSTSLFQLH